MHVLGMKLSRGDEELKGAELISMWLQAEFRLGMIGFGLGWSRLKRKLVNYGGIISCISNEVISGRN